MLLGELVKVLLTRLIRGLLQSIPSVQKKKRVYCPRKKYDETEKYVIGNWALDLCRRLYHI